MGQALKMCANCENKRGCDACIGLHNWIMEHIDTEPVRHGKWITQDTSRTKFMCSECKFKNYGGHEKYCPNCGAKMDGE